MKSEIAALVQMRKDAPGLWPDSWYQQKIGQLMGMSKTDILEEVAALTGAVGNTPPDNRETTVTEPAMVADEV